MAALLCQPGLATPLLSLSTAPSPSLCLQCACLLAYLAIPPAASGILPSPSLAFSFRSEIRLA
jgi:hypothetical protein